MGLIDTIFKVNRRHVWLGALNLTDGEQTGAA